MVSDEYWALMREAGVVDKPRETGLAPSVKTPEPLPRWMVQEEDEFGDLEFDFSFRARVWAVISLALLAFWAVAIVWFFS